MSDHARRLQSIELGLTGWAANTKHCSHRHGTLLSEDKSTTYKYEVIITPDFLEVTIHLDIDRDEYFHLAPSGSWEVRRDHELLISGKPSRTLTDQ